MASRACRPQISQDLFAPLFPLHNSVETQKKKKKRQNKIGVIRQLGFFSTLPNQPHEKDTRNQIYLLNAKSSITEMGVRQGSAEHRTCNQSPAAFPRCRSRPQGAWQGWLRAPPPSLGFSPERSQPWAHNSQQNSPTRVNVGKKSGNMTSTCFPWG